MSQKLTLPNELYRRLNEAADRQGVSVAQLLAQVLPLVEAAINGAVQPTIGEDLLVDCTRALLDGCEPPIQADWEELKNSLLQTEPLYETVEDAMTALRRRAWSKGE